MTNNPARTLPHWCDPTKRRKQKHTRLFSSPPFLSPRGLSNANPPPINHYSGCSFCKIILGTFFSSHCQSHSCARWRRSRLPHLPPTPRFAKNKSKQYRSQKVCSAFLSALVFAPEEFNAAEFSGIFVRLGF